MLSIYARRQHITKQMAGFLQDNVFIHSVFCLTTGPKPPPKRCLHIVRSRVSSFKWEYPLLSLRSSSSFLRLLPRVLVTSISSLIFPSITCFRRRFLRKMCPIQLAFSFLISCRIFLWFSYILFIIIIGGILVLFVYITRQASNEVFSPSNKIHREVGRAKDLSRPLYKRFFFFLQQTHHSPTWKVLFCGQFW